MSRRTARRGFTLTELIVVIAIIGFLATLTALYFPRFQDSEYVRRGTDSLQMWLIMAKQQARRDGRPTGLRFTVNNSTCRSVHYIQQPEDSAQGKYVGSWKKDDPAAGVKPTAFFRLPVLTTTPTKTYVQFKSARLPVKPGDYLELYGGGVVRRIVDIPADPNDPTMFNRLVLETETAELPGPVLPQPSPPGPPPDTLANIPDYATDEVVNYRIIRQPEVIPGEQELVFPENVGIDFNLNNSANPVPDGTDRPMSRGLAGLPAPRPPSFTCDILFAPSGALIGASAQNVQVIFWVRDLTRPNNPDLLAGHATLVTVQPRTGFIASHPAASGSDPYLFTKDAKSSGM
jgi:prepilin-type N-terminal cleavage/methylation domain-containing protein